MTGGGATEVRGSALPQRSSEARDHLERLVAEAGWTGDADLLLLAVQEALTNAVRHGRGLRWATAVVSDDEVVVEVADGGEEFDPGPYLRGTPDAMVERGRGLWMMGQLASAVDVRHDGDGNTVVLRFRADGAVADRTPSAPSALAALAVAAHPLFEAITAATLVVDDRLVVCEANSSALALFGCTAEEAVGSDIRGVVASARELFREPDEFVDRVLELHAHPDEQADDLLVLADGSMMRRRSFPVRADDGRVLGRLDAYSKMGEESSAIAAMQRALLPSLPDWPGLDVGAIYHPATSSAFVGGDFYDFVDLPGGARCAVVGDVSGRGSAAAAASATVRAYLRASLESSGVTAAFADVDRAVTRELGEEEFVTLVVAMEEAPGVWTALSCGHEPPLLLTGGEVHVLDLRGELLGMGLGGTRVRRTFTLRSGDALLLYTDGVVDAGFGTHRFGLDRLLAALREGEGLPAQQLVALVDRRVHEMAGTRIPDDHALVALVVP
jgi:serine phosphatase RsbU (regulator of sigma subunit)/anti-sigma regulatory factor (Ser/Thr protein kinase)